jgi:hypothetical protein
MMSKKLRKIIIGYNGVTVNLRGRVPKYIITPII